MITLKNISPLLQLMRPYQWSKNVFVFSGILFGEHLMSLSMVIEAIVVFIAFSLVSSAVYILNDYADLEQDRAHLVKRHRPLASGEVSERHAFILLLTCLGSGLLLATLLSFFAELPYTVLALLSIYFLINVAYSFRLKDIIILDVFTIASGFMLRLLAGTEGLNISASNWLLLCGIMTALFIAFVKRRSELFEYHSNPSDKPKEVLKQYSPQALDIFIVITATSIVLSYSLYTMAPATAKVHGTEKLIYTVPVVAYGIFRYLHLLYTKAIGSDPARDLFQDTHMLLTGLVWILTTLVIIL